MAGNDIYRRVIIYLLIIVSTATEAINGYAIRLVSPVDGRISGDVLRLGDDVRGNSAGLVEAVLRRGDDMDIKTDKISGNILRVGGIRGHFLRLGDDNSVNISEVSERVHRLDDDVDGEVDINSEQKADIGGNRLRLGVDKDDVRLDDVAVHLKDAGSNGIGNLQHYVVLTSVHHFARHRLCRNRIGRRRFYKAMKAKLCQIKSSFVADFVEEMCKEKGKQLDKWVSEIFDFDGDGYVTHFEKHFYEFAQ